MRSTCVAVLLWLCAAGVAGAQEMEPKSYSASPVGANFLVTAISRSTGSIIFDESLPIDDVHADVTGLAIGYGHSFNLFGDLGLMTAVIPIAWADATGKVFEDTRSVSRDGLGDMRLKLSVNLRGNPAMSPREFAASPKRTIVGASLTTLMPTGQYDRTKLINLGADRWGFKPEVGISWPVGRWDIDTYLAMVFFTTNAHFFPGDLRREQDPVLAIQGHASYTVKPRLWIAADGTWYRGGSSRVGDGTPSEALNNSRLGVTASLPVGNRYSIKLAYGNGVIVRTGSNFNTVTVGVQALWLSPRWSGR